MTTLLQKLQRIGVGAAEVHNVHVHLPELNAQNRTFYTAESHAMLPKHVLTETLPMLDPQAFLKENAHLFGMNVLLPVGPHNLLGKKCPIFASNRYVLGLAAKYPETFIPFGTLNLSLPSAPRMLEKLKGQGIQGIKYHALEGYDLCTPEGSEINPRLVQSFAKMVDLDLPLVIHLGDTPFPQVNLHNADPKTLIPIANRFPDLRMLITHFGTPLHHAAFWVAGRYENIFMDTAEFPLYWTPDADNPYGPLLSPLHIKRVGAQKMIFGTDFPMPTFFKNETGTIEIRSHHPRDYLSALVDLPSHYLTPAEKRAILTENIWKFIGSPQDAVIAKNRRIVVDP